MAEMIGAVAGLLWPLLVLAALVVFRAPLSRLIRSAEEREWTLEVGGQRLLRGATESGSTWRPAPAPA